MQVFAIPQVYQIIKYFPFSALVTTLTGFLVFLLGRKVMLWMIRLV